MARISGVVIALNEAHQLHYALSTLMPWCDEVIVVDQHSEDETASIAEEMGATVHQHDRTGGIADPAGLAGPHVQDLHGRSGPDAARGARRGHLVQCRGL